MRSIPTKMRQEMNNNPYYKKCALRSSECGGRITYHHVWIYAGKQINAIWAIVPACERHHELVNINPEVKEAFELISLERSTPEDLLPYPRKDWDQIKCYLTEKLHQRLSTSHID